MKPVYLALAVCACLQSSFTAFAQQTLPGTHAGASNSVAASNRPRTVQEDTAAAAAATTTPTSGTFVAKFTIKLSTAVPSGGSVLCDLNASVEDENPSTYTLNNQILEESEAKATVSGSTATCTVKIPYAWYLSNPSSDTVALSYYLYILGAASSTSSPLEARVSSQYVPGAGAIKVPSSGSTTTYTISATL